MKTVIKLKFVQQVALLCLGIAVLPLTILAQSSKTVEDFTLTDVDGVETSLYAELETGRFVLLDFFSVQCHICKENTAKVNRIQENYSDFLSVWKMGVYGPDREPPSWVEDFNRWYDSKVRAFPNATAALKYFNDEFNIGYGTPTYVLISPDHKVSFIYRGFNDDVMRRKLNDAMFLPTSVSERQDLSAEVKIAPQPVRDVMTLSVPADQQIKVLTIVDGRGVEIARLSGGRDIESTGAVELDLTALNTANGVHMLRIEFADGGLAQRSFVLVR